jgi:beta-glucoside PTS system EIICBA component
LRAINSLNEQIKAAGYNVITPVILVNTNHYSDVITVNSQRVKAGDSLLKVIV